MASVVWEAPNNMDNQNAIEGTNSKSPATETMEGKELQGKK